ncbi:MAG: hypothetical protein IJR63_11605 [Synergistaceae bacterium]|nr:hypothetical protein [Synergistaceae bacterium]
MKVDTRYSSMWDELHVRYEPRVPETQEEAEKLHEAAEASMHDSLMKTVDAHNESVRQAAELRKKTRQKQEIESRVIQHREEQRKILEEEAVKRKRNAEIFA